MADDPSKKKPKSKKARFPAPELAKNKPAGIPKSYYDSPEVWRQDYNRNVPGIKEEGHHPAHGPVWRQYNEQPLTGPNPFVAPDLGAGMNPFSGGVVGTIEPPPPVKIPPHPTSPGLTLIPRPDLGPDFYTDERGAFWRDPNYGKPPMPKGGYRPWYEHEFADLPNIEFTPPPSRMGDAQQEWRKTQAYLYGDGVGIPAPSPIPDLTTIHPEARNGLYPSKPFLGQYQVGWDENPPYVDPELAAFKRHVAGSGMDGGYEVPPPGQPDARTAIRKGYATQHLTDYPMPTYKPRAPLTFNPVAVEAADMAGIPTTLPSLGAGFAFGAGHTLGEMYAPIDTRALDRALMQTQDTVERFMYPQPVYRGVRAGRDLLGQGMTAVGNAATAGGNWLLEQAMGTPQAVRTPAASRQIIPTDMRLDPFVSRLMADPVGQQGAGRAKPRKKTKR